MPRLGQFLHDELALELSETKTLITHARTSAARFLGYEITVQHDDRKLTAGRRTVNGGIRLRVPREVIATKCARYMQRGKPERRPELMNVQAHAIISQYGAEYRGIVQYYLLAGDVYRLNRLRWVMVTSLLKTLARKHDSTVTKIARKHAATIQTPDGPRECMQAIVDRGEGKHRWSPRSVAFRSAAEERGPAGPRSGPSDLPPQRADTPALGGAVRDLRRTGEGASAPDSEARRPRQDRTAAARMGADHGTKATQNPRGLRTLPCQYPLQEGARVNHDITAGEPGELKGSRRVREGGQRKRSAHRHRASGLPHQRGRYDERRLARVREQAAWLSRRRRRWCRRGAVPVVCLVRAQGVQRLEQNVLVVSIDRLLPVLRSSAGRSAPDEPGRGWALRSAGASR